MSPVQKVSVYIQYGEMQNEEFWNFSLHSWFSQFPLFFSSSSSSLTVLLSAVGWVTQCSDHIVMQSDRPFFPIFCRWPAISQACGTAVLPQAAWQWNGIGFASSIQRRLQAAARHWMPEDLARDLLIPCGFLFSSQQHALLAWTSDMIYLPIFKDLLFAKQITPHNFLQAFFSMVSGHPSSQMKRGHKSGETLQACFIYFNIVKMRMHREIKQNNSTVSCLNE